MTIPRHSRIWTVAALSLLSIQPANANVESTPLTAGPLSTAAAPINIEGSRFAATVGKASSTQLILRFRNTGSAPVDEVRFNVHYNGSGHAIVDKGIFSPGVLIVHTFVADRPLAVRDTADATVGYVHFADGTHWGELPPDLSRRQAQERGS